MRCWSKILILLAAVLAVLPESFSQETKIVDFSADTIWYDEKFGKGIQRLIGNVWMQHKNLTLTCDSAHLDQAANRFKGYSRVHIIKSDTLNVWSRQVDYDGQLEMAKLEGQVRMVNGQVSLKAPRVDYNMKEEVAWYYGGGQLIDTTNTVESFWGYYYIDRHDLFFKENVVLTNPDNTLITDSLNYNSETEKMWFVGPSQIFSDTNYIYCRRGSYDSRNRISVFNDSVFMQAKEQLLRTDSLIYDQEAKNTEAFKNVFLRDTVEDMIITGEHLYYDEAENWFRMTEDVQFILAEEKDSLYLHADTLISARVESRDSRRIQAHPRVQFFRTDIQGRCDSLDYLVADSLIRLFKSPVIWQDNNQLSADTLEIRMGDDGIRLMRLKKSGFLITREDSVSYNQIKGKDIVGFFNEDKLIRVEVTGNGESLFYPKDGDAVIGLNKALSSNILISLKDSKIDRIAFLREPDSKLTPLKDVNDTDRYLDGFKWQGDKRPATRDDIKVWK